MVSAHFFSRLISSWFAFVLPLFRSFQALQHRPTSNADVEHWAKYWIVIGALVAFEYSVEFLISWFPFYWELKLLLLLFISLPQTKGSTYVYDTWLAPFLSRNEIYIDRQIGAARENFLGLFQSQIQTVLDRVTGKLQATSSESASASGPDAGPAPSIQGAARLAMSFLTDHGITLAGRNDAARATNSQPGTPSLKSGPFASASSTSIQTNLSGDANHRDNFASESQAPFQVTPEQIYQAQATRAGSASPAAFPEPEHF